MNLQRVIRDENGQFRAAPGIPPLDLENVAEMYEAGWRIVEIANMVDRHPSTIGNVLTRMDIPRRSRSENQDGVQKLPEDEFERVRRMYEVDKMTLQQIGDTIGITRGAVLYRLRRYGVPRRSRSEANKMGAQVRLKKQRASR